MKIKIVILALVVFAMSACTQKTCPTYAKSDVEASELSK